MTASTTSERGARAQWRFRLLTCCLALTTLTFIQQPGRIVADTKLDLALNPGGFLSRAFDLWDPQGSFGQVQNQAYGYFFPMGPFFWLGDTLGLDSWIVQRLWWSLLLSVAFLGMVKLAGELGVRSPAARLIAGFAFALSPRMLSVIGPSSIEVWPSALAPWVLLPLIIGTRRGSPVRMAALSALGVMCVGGVNAAATFAVIPLGALWLLMSPPGPRRRRLMLWWPFFVLLGTLWWLIPLFLLGAYSPPFLDFIESASNTTVAATVFDALRGTTNWVPYVSANANAGRDLIAQPLLIINGAVVILLGLVGLARRGTPHRRFLLVGLATGLVLVTAGHIGALTGWGSASVQSALDGVLAPLRNTHKFDVVIRIPLVLGLAHLLSALIEGSREDKRSDDAVRTLGVGVLAVAALVGATSPAWAGHLGNKGSFETIPNYWQEASSWLDDNAEGKALLVPASAFPDYLWGSTGDEAIQPLSAAKWAVRNSIPLTNAGTIQFLDAITTELAQGRSSPGLVASLRRSGVEYLVLRNDLDSTRLPDNAEAVSQTIAATEGITEVRSFGPEVGSDPEGLGGDLRTFVNGGWQAKHRAVEVFRVGPAQETSVQDLSSTPTVIGTAGSLVDLDGLGLSGGASVFLAQDQPDEVKPSTLIMTDESRRREAAFGSVFDNRSGSLTTADRYALRRPVHDYVTAPDVPWQAVPRIVGAKGLSASSSRSTATTVGGAQPANQPFAAFDGDERTSWVADGRSGSLTLDLDARRDLGTITVGADLAPGMIQNITVDTESGPRKLQLVGNGPETVDVGTVSRLHIRGEARSGQFFSLAEVAAPGLSVERPLRLPDLPLGWASPQAIALGVDGSARPGCLTVKSIVRCRADVESWGEDGATLDREISLPKAAAYGVTVKVAPIGGTALDAFLQKGIEGSWSASSTVNRDPRAGVLRLADGDTKTGWISRPGDTDPTVKLRWESAQTIEEIFLATDQSLPASAPTFAVLDFDNGEQRRVELNDGRAEFDPVTARQVDVHLSSATPTKTFDSGGLSSDLPVGVSELGFGRDAQVRFNPSDEAVDLPCGSGPDLIIGGRTHETSVRTSRADLAQGLEVTASLCVEKDVTLAEGRSRIHLAANELFRPTSVVLREEGEPVPVESSGVARKDASAVSRSIALREGPDRVVSTTENFNPGWEASEGQTELDAVQVNGWQQGWVAPVGTQGRVDLRFAPNSTYHAGLAVGGLTALLLLIIALWRWPDRGHPVTDKVRGRHPVLTAVLIVAAAGIVGGSGLLVAGVAGALIGWFLQRKFSEPEWIIAIPISVAALLYAISPWGGTGSWAGYDTLPQICVGLALGTVAVTLFADRHDLSRKNGSSTNR